MTLNPPQDYTLELLESGSYRISDATGVCTFSKPASAKGTAKLYTLASGGQLFYVGIASQPMSARLNFGFKANGESGYYGYKWKDVRGPLTLSVWTAHVAGTDVRLRAMETIEAEVAFLCRQRSGQWPPYQTEIHFFPSDEGHRAAAVRIYEHARGKQRQQLNF